MSTPESHAASLLEDGFIEVPEFGNFKIGTRIRHNGQRWPDAYERGTGTVERIFRQPVSEWERTYGRPNVELIVKRDNPELGSTHQFVADYHVAAVEVAA